MSREDYVAKMENFLDSSGCKVSGIDTSFSFPVHVQEVSCAVLNSTSLIKNPLSLLNPNPKPPRLYGLPKLHKLEIPLGPVACYIPAPTCDLAKFLYSWFKSIFEHMSTFSVKNSSELTEKIKNVIPSQGSVPISFDIKSLFPNVPIPLTLEVFGHTLNDSDVPMFI